MSAITARMDPRSFTERRTGSLVSISEGGVAFVPETLPPKPDFLTAPVFRALSDATIELGRLDGQASDFPHSEVLMAPFMRREAVLSSRIEGTQTTYSDLVLFEAAAEQIDAGQDTREVSNYVAALQYGLSRAGKSSISKALMCETHRLLMTGTNEEARSGAFRTEQVYIGPKGLPISESRFVPPPVVHLDSSFDDLVRYINDDDGLPLLVRLAIIHYQFEAIHPFFDGNGRIGRLIMPLLLCHAGTISKPMFYLSAYFERRRIEYNDLLFSVSADGRWAQWITFFLNGVSAQARDSRQRMRQLQLLRGQYWSLISRARNAPALLKLVDALIELPAMSNARAQSILGQSLQSSSAAVDRLVAEKILSPLERPGRAEYFVAREIFEIIDRAEAVSPQNAAALDTQKMPQAPDAATYDQRGTPSAPSSTS
jgi:cell filamentation protein, protein adenylyltransferase